MSTNDWIERDLTHVWHPCSQMKDYEKFPPLLIKSAQGSYLKLSDGRQIIDAISSWWCKSLGHQHPALKKALITQANKFEHVIIANTTHETLIQLSEKLSTLCVGLNKVFYAGDGSSAIEIALKMSLQTRQIQGQTKRQGFIALENGYHGETFGALSVSDLGLYRAPYDNYLFKPHFISGVPYLHSKEDPLWHNCEAAWQSILPQLERLADTTTAIIVEPIIQGAGNMQIYSPDFLKRLRTFTQQNDIHLIADEIMTGLGRTGEMLACDHAKITPDFICLSKNLTGGTLAFSAVLTSSEIYDLFYDDYETAKAFMHSHTFSGNALGCAVALAMFDVMESEKIIEKSRALGEQMKMSLLKITSETGLLKNVRQIGAIAAADLNLAVCLKRTPNLNSTRLGYQIYQAAVKRGALLRPLGNTLYWLPPLNTTDETIAELSVITRDAIEAVV